MGAMKKTHSFVATTNVAKFETLSTTFRWSKLSWVAWDATWVRASSSWCQPSGIIKFYCFIFIILSQYFLQCSRSMKFWYGSRSADSYFWLMDPDPDPAIFVSDLQDVNCLLLFEGIFTSTSFFKHKKSYRSHKTVGINVFLLIFAWW